MGWLGGLAGRLLGGWGIAGVQVQGIVAIVVLAAHCLALRQGRCRLTVRAKRGPRRATGGRIQLRWDYEDDIVELEQRA